MSVLSVLDDDVIRRQHDMNVFHARRWREN